MSAEVEQSQEDVAVEAGLEASPVAGDGVAALVEAILRPRSPSPEEDAPDVALPPLDAADRAQPSRPAGGPAHTDVVAALIGAEAGAAIGLLWFGWTPLMPIAVTLGAAAAGPLVVRATRPVRMLLFRHWLRSQLSGPAS